MHRQALVFLLLITVEPDLAFAEGGCPPGQFPQGGQGWQSCIPGQTSFGQTQAWQEPRWVDRWGAIATDGIKGILGAVDNISNVDGAERLALLDCQSQGGDNCKVILSYSNRCGVMTVGDNGYAASSGPTMAEATKKSMKKCESDGDKGCHVYYSGCSSPVLVQ